MTQISEKRFSSPAQDAAPWLVRHWQQAALAVAALAVGGFMTISVVSSLRKVRERGWEQLAFAQSQADQGKAEGALQTVESLLQTTRSGPLAVQALMLKADFMISAGKKDEALSAVQEASRQASGPEYRALALAHTAFVLEESGKRDEAAAHYDRFIKEFPDHFLTGRAYACLGRLQIALGRNAEAQATLERLAALYPTTVWARDAKVALERLKPAKSG